MGCTQAFTFLESFYRQAELMTQEQAHRYLMGLCAFAFDGVVPEFEDDPILRMAWVSTSSAIEANLKQRADGKKGGRPKKTGLDTGVKTPLKTPVSDEENEGSEGESALQETPLKTPLKPNKRKVKEIKVNKRKDGDEECKRQKELERMYNQTVGLP